MTEQRTRMKIAIDGKVYTLDTGIRKSLTQIPWESRKKVIAVLEAVKQAEHVETSTPQATDQPIKKPVQPTALVNSTIKPQPMSEDGSSEYNSKDPDAIMQQLIMQQPKSHNIPDKGTAIKWLALFFAVVISLAILI